MMTDHLLGCHACMSQLQAFKLFRERTGTDQHFRVHLEKRVPHGGLSPSSSGASSGLYSAPVCIWQCCHAPPVSLPPEIQG